jgi:methyltransferase
LHHTLAKIEKEFLDNTESKTLFIGQPISTFREKALSIMNESKHVPSIDKSRKKEAKELKRKLISESGGMRPRKELDPTDRKTNVKRKKESSHRFGRVMEIAPCRDRPRTSTLSIAIPGSIVSNCQTKELQTLLVGQLARAATIYHVDEIIVFDDKLSVERKAYYKTNRANRESEHEKSKNTEGGTPESSENSKKSDPHTFMARVLQYCECPQYLRRNFFPMHRDLQFTGLLSPIDAPHHVRADDRCKYREGIVLEKKGPNGFSLVNCGIRNRPVEIDRVLKTGIRCTVQLDIKSYGSVNHMKGKVVSPSTPREDDGTYWGYTTRLAESIYDAINACPFEEGYDLKIGTSERGDITVDDDDFRIPTYKHSLIVFGGVSGIEECVDADENCKIPGSLSKKLFDFWVNTVPFQGSRTVRTEEAVIISLAKLSPHLMKSQEESQNSKSKPEISSQQSNDCPKFSDSEVSEESDGDEK